MNFNQVLNISEYTPTIPYRKEWELDRIYRTLDHFGILDGYSTVLGVGTGRENTPYRISPDVERVWATDIYGTDGMWTKDATFTTLIDPKANAPTSMPYDLRRITFCHMSAMHLYFPDEMFDAAFSTSSIEHFGTWDDILQAAREVYRVLSPGGIFTFCTEYKISGNGDGWQGVKMFDRERIEWLARESGFVPVDDLNLQVDDDTLATAYPLEKRVKGHCPPREAVLTFQDYMFTSVHLTWMKPDN